MENVGVVITAFKNHERLEKALRSVVNQTYKELEIIIVDGSNSEKIKEVCGNFKDKRIRYIGIKKDKGVQNARNIGCKLAKSKFVSTLDDDDTWKSKKIEKQMEMMDHDIALVVSYAEIVQGDKVIIDKPPDWATYGDMLKNFNFSFTSTYLFRKSVLKEVGWFNEVNMGMHEYYVALKIAKKRYRIRTVQEPLVTRVRYLEKDSDSMLSKYTHVKITETLELWQHFGKDVYKELGLIGYIKNSIKMTGLISLYFLGYFMGDIIWKIIYPIKRRTEKR